MRIEHYKSRPPSTSRALFSFFTLIAVVAIIVIVLLGIIVVLNNNEFGAGAATLNPLERGALRAYLMLNRDTILNPMSKDTTPVPFVVSKGEGISTITQKLATLKLIREAEVLRRYMQYQGWDDNIEAGSFTLNAAMNTPAIAKALTKATPDEIIFRVWEGWRLEQIADSLANQPNLAVSRDEFLSIVRAGGKRGSYSFIGDIPANAPLEGFLYPDTYRFLPKTTTAQVVDRILSEFDKQFTAQMRTDAAKKNLTVYQVVTLASIVEREAVKDEERPIIASVFLNRLKINMRLDADPTTQYAIATSATWWPPLNFDPRTINHPFNTYVNTGLPPTPIANPSLKSMQAVIYSVDTKYIYFRAKCDGSKTHNFSVTYEEHLAYGCK
ncbi:MAG: endolytic transglycosylase MltG, partial [Chloroflexota bacterium]